MVGFHIQIQIQTPNIYLGLGFEFAFGPQRIRILAIMCPLSVTEMKPEILANQHYIKLMRPLYDFIDDLLPTNSVISVLY